jgi:hypothetical protein
MKTLTYKRQWYAKERIAYFLKAGRLILTARDRGPRYHRGSRESEVKLS